MAAPPLRADARRNQARIIAAAAELFAVHGIEAQMAEIARRAGVGNATVFRHFPTKRDLLLAVMEDRMAEMRARADEALALDDPVEGLRQLLGSMCAAFVSDHALKQMTATMFEGDERMAAPRDALLARLAELVARAKAAGAVREDAEPVDFVVMVHAVASAVIGLEEDVPGLHRRYLALAFAGFTASGASGDPLPVAAPTAGDIDRAWRREARRTCGP